MKNIHLQTALIMLVCTVGCSRPVDTPPSETPLSTSLTQVSATAPMPPTVSPNAAPSFTPSLVTPLLTPTIQPTLVPKQARDLVWALLKGNGECQLPCLWGLTPGGTPPQVFNAFITQFGNGSTSDAYIEGYDYEDLGGFTLIQRENRVQTRVDFSYYRNSQSAQVEQLVMHAFTLQEDNDDLPWKGKTSFVYGAPSFADDLQYYTLPSILTNYGKPSQVLIQVLHNASDEPQPAFYPFALVLFYEKQGFFVEYIFSGEIVDDYYIGCPSESHINMSAWALDMGLPIATIMKRGGQIAKSLDSLKGVDIATSMTLEEFLSVFEKPTTDCIQTPINLWSEP